MLNTFQKMTRKDATNFFGVGPGARFKDMIKNQLAQKDRDIKYGKVGARKMENRKMGYADSKQKKNKAVVN
jgi:hypothetical protein